MKRIILLLTLLFVFSVVGFSQAVTHTAYRTRGGATLPATCTYTTALVDIFIKSSGASQGFYTCNPNGISWDGPYPTVAGLADPGGNGIVVRTALNTTINRSIAATGPVVVSNSDGTTGNPTLSCPTCTTPSTTDAFTNKTLTDPTNHISGAVIDSGTLPNARIVALPLANLAVVNATGGSAAPTAVVIGSCSAGSSALTYNTTTHAFGCNTISASPGGANTQVQFNDSNVFNGSALFTFNKTTGATAINGVLTVGDGTEALPGMAFLSAPSYGWWHSGVNNFFSTNGSASFLINTSRIGIPSSYPLGWSTSLTGAANDVGLGRTSAGLLEVNDGATLGVFRDLQVRNARLSAKVTNFNSVATAGFGVPAIYAAGRVTAQTAAASSVATYTVGAADGSFIVSANVNVTTSTTHNFSVEIAYTDETNTARVVTFNVQQLGGTLVTAITNVTGAGPYEGVPLHIRAKASTAITIRTNAGGTYTTVTYNAEGVIQQIQ
jgi:hypothetical protein